jgi:hypothetical protein
LSFASLAPEIGEIVFVIASPGIEVFVRGQFGIIAEEFEERTVSGGKEIEKALGNFGGERLFSARRPGRLPRRFWTLFKFGQSRVHSGFKAIGW